MVLYSTAASAFLLFASVRVVPPGHVGVAVVFGSVREEMLSGPHLVNPFASVKLFLTKTRLLEQDNNVPTQEGLIVELDVAMLYHIDPSRARDLLINLGEDYENVVVKPELSSAVRGLTSEQEAKALYTSGRSEIQKVSAAHRGPCWYLGCGMCGFASVLVTLLVAHS
jgi:regulator of protease activity HflC (stomatin/prohibitin superfamily)